MNNDKLYPLPSGGLTPSFTEYCAIWRELGKKMCSLWPEGHAELSSFGDGIDLWVRGRSAHVHFPADVALLIAKLM